MDGSDGIQKIIAPPKISKYEDPNHFFRRYPSDDDALDKTDSRRWKAFVRKSRSFKTGKNDFFGCNHEINVGESEKSWPSRIRTRGAANEGTFDT